MNFLQKEKGFTLIELLVVVSIIGILSTIVLSSLGEARKRAEYAKIQTELRQLQTQIEIYAIENEDYGNNNTISCPTSHSITPVNVFESLDVFALIEDLADELGVDDLGDIDNVVCSARQNEYSFSIVATQYMSFENNSNGTTNTNGLVLCIDDSGNVKTRDAVLADDYAGSDCPPEGTIID